MESAKKTVVINAGIRVTDPEKFMALSADVIAQTRKESGCLRYDLLRDVDDPNVFFFIEEYVDDAAFAAHRDMPYMEPFRAARATVLDKYLGVKKLREE